MKTKPGAPKKDPTITPGLRVNKEKWKAIQAKYPRQINKLFNQWLETL